MSDYNFCPQCGTQLKPDARFCSECGTRLDAYEVDLRAAVGNDASPQVEKTCAPQAAEDGVPQQTGNVSKTQTNESSARQQAGSARKAQAADSDPVQAAQAPTTDAADPASAGNGASTSSFAAAVESTKHRSRRRVPLVVLVALALALTSAVAFAAYQVYTQVIAPAMQAQQQQAEGETQAEEPQEPITYTTETKTMTATMPVDPITNTAWTTDGMTKLSYEQLVPSRQSDAVDKINATIEQAIQDTAAVTSAKAEQQASGSADEQVARNVCTDRLIYVTYLTDSVVCFFDLSYVTGYGPHGWAERGGIAFSLETGEQVSMSSVAGVDQSELIDLTCTAEETYLAANPKAYSTISSKVLETTRKTLTDNQGKLKKTTPGLEDEECFCLGEDGMYYLTSDYEMGSYADGTRNICIAAFSDQSLVGTSAKLEKGI